MPPKRRMSVEFMAIAVMVLMQRLAPGGRAETFYVILQGRKFTS